MTTHDFRLPSGAMCTRQRKPGAIEYYVWTGNGPLARLTAADVELLFADSIADSGRTPSSGAQCGARHCCACNYTCTLEPGHHRPHERDGIRWEQQS